MSAPLLDTVYVAAIPPWLVQVVADANIPYSALTDLSKMAEYLTVKDFARYYWYVTETHNLTEGLFAPLKPLTSHRALQTWMAENGKRFQKEIDLCAARAKAVALGKGGDDELDIAVSRANYTPYCVGDNALLLLGHSDTVYPDKLTYFRTCVEQLGLLVPWEALVTTTLFERYVRLPRL